MSCTSSALQKNWRFFIRKRAVRGSWKALVPLSLIVLATLRAIPLNHLPVAGGGLKTRVCTSGNPKNKILLQPIIQYLIPELFLNCHPE